MQCSPRRISSASATHDAATLRSIDSAVIQGSKRPRPSTVNASMPIKCIDQMPPPNAIAPDPRAISRMKRVSALRAKPAISSASTDASTAIATDSVTSQGSCWAHSSG